jgi:hypothetical protein
MAKAKKQESAGTEEMAAKPKAAAAAPAKKAPAKKEAAAEAKPAASAAKKPAAAAAAAAAAPKKAGKPAAGGGGKPLVPLIDTGLAAQTAAAMVAHRVAGGAASAPSQESSTFKNLKESLSKPTAGGLGGILGTGSGQKKFPQQFGGGKQGGPGAAGGRNQTFGADVNRAGVPRRTGGG